MATAKNKEICDKREKKEKTKKDRVKITTVKTEDTANLYYHVLYSESLEGWIACQQCGRWAQCVDVDDENAVHTCPICN